MIVCISLSATNDSASIDRRLSLGSRQWAAGTPAVCPFELLVCPMPATVRSPPELRLPTTSPSVAGATTTSIAASPDGSHWVGDACPNSSMPFPVTVVSPPFTVEVDRPLTVMSAVPTLSGHGFAKSSARYWWTPDAAESTVTVVCAESSLDWTVSVRSPASPDWVCHWSVKLAVCAFPSETLWLSTVEPLTPSVMVSETVAAPVFVTSTLTSTVSPSATGPFVPVMATEKSLRGPRCHSVTGRATPLLSTHSTPVTGRLTPSTQTARSVGPPAVPV